MARRNIWSRSTAAGLALIGIAIGSLPAVAQQPSGPALAQTPAQAQAPAPAPQTEGQAQAAATGAEAAPNTGRVSLSLGADWVSAYYFRGIVNEQNGGNNVQPYGEVGFKLLDNVGPLTSLVIAPGIWNNWHWGGGTVAAASDPSFWYEADLYLKLSATWREVFTTSLTYTYYTSPNDGFPSYGDLGLGLGLNDSKWLGAFALNPSILFAFETQGEALVADGSKGIYMGISLAPGYTFFEKSSHPVNLSLPMTFGFSLKDYYTVNGQDQTFGYFSGGPLVTMPLKFIPAAYGSWSLKAGVQFLVLNDNLKAVNTNDGVVPIGTVGLSISY